MKNLLQLLVALFFYTAVFAQEKYAVLVGINQYYSTPGVPHNKVLQGCVNDAFSIKGMLTQRFGYTENNIKMLLNEQATRKTVLTALNEILNKAKAGDAIVFYFSGHGVWMSNADQTPLDKKVKDGMNQAMVMSDLYSSNLDCLFTDALVKTTFNKFVDKKIIVTSIFDCCFAGTISQLSSPFAQNPYNYTETPGEKKSLSFDDAFEAYRTYCNQNPDQCNMDSLNIILSEELFGVDSTRSFNLKDAISISDSRIITRPSERTNSMFLSLAGTDQYQKGLEIKDESGLFHGAYTAALLQAIKTSNSDITVAELIKKINALMKKQFYQQSPTNFYDPNRLNKNLLGIAPSNFNNSITAKCIAVNGNGVLLDAGYYDGLSKGNILSIKNGSSKINIVINKIDKETSTAKIPNGNISKIKKGDIFSLTDGYSISAPLVNVFIQDNNFTTIELNNLFNEKIIPLTKLKGYWDYENWYAMDPSINLFFNDKNSKATVLSKELLSGKRKDSFLVFLPIPSNVSNSVKKILRGNQNIQLVGEAGKADLILYLNYTKAMPGFIYTWYNFRGSDVNNSTLKFSDLSVKTPSLNLDNNALKKLTADIFRLTTMVARRKSNQWFNEYLRR